MSDVLTGILLGLLGAILLETTFRLILSRWPEGYTSSTRMIERAPKYSVWSYALFRFVPTFIVALLSVVTAGRLGASTVATAVTLGIVYVLERDIRAMFDAYRRKDPRLGILVVLYGINMALVAAAIALSMFLRDVLAGMVPSPRELISALWTAVFVAILAFVVEKMFQRDSLHAPTLVKARSDLGSDLEKYVRDAAVRANCSPELILAVVLTEIEQRPAWFRTGERIVGRLARRQEITYGVGQVRSKSPISDEQSVDKLCEELSSVYPGRMEYGDSLPLRLILADHNPDPVFVRTAFRWYVDLTPTFVAASPVTVFDRRSSVEVYTPQYHGSTMIISGSTASCKKGEIWRIGIDEESSFSINIDASVVPQRTEFSFEVPVDFGVFHLLFDREIIGPGFSLDSCSVLPW